MFLKVREKLESYIGPNTSFTGDVKTKGTFRVDGSIVGNIEADYLVLGEKGSIKGNVSVSGAIVGGIIEGDVSAKGCIDIKHKGSIFGDIKTSKLAVAEGGILDGKTNMKKEVKKAGDQIHVIDFAKTNTPG